MQMKRKLLLVPVTLAAVVGFFAIQSVSARHPHFNKTVNVKIGEVDAKLSYFTAPANEEHVKNAAVGAVSAGFATLSLSGDLKAGETTIKAGDYTVGAIKQGENQWTMALHQGKLGFSDKPDMAKVSKLGSNYSKDHGTAHHIYFDIMPGHGDTEGKTVLIWHFGGHYLTGIIS